MADWSKNVLNWIKLKPKYLMGPGITCLIVVGLPKAWREYLGYSDLINPYRGWGSLAGIALCVYGTILLITDIKPWIVARWVNWRIKRQAPKKLRELAKDEKRYLAEYIKNDASSLNFLISNGIINALIKKGVIYRGALFSVEDDIFAYNVRTWVLKALDKYPDLKSDIVKYTSELSLHEESSQW